MSGKLSNLFESDASSIIGVATDRSFLEFWVYFVACPILSGSFFYAYSLFFPAVLIHKESFLGAWLIVIWNLMPSFVFAIYFVFRRPNLKWSSWLEIAFVSLICSVLFLLMISMLFYAADSDLQSESWTSFLPSFFVQKSFLTMLSLMVAVLLCRAILLLTGVSPAEMHEQFNDEPTP